MGFVEKINLMPKVYIGLGSNIGNKSENVRQALKLISQIDSTKVKKVSSFYKTEPVGYEDQDWFINAVAEIETDLSPETLLETLKNIEKLIGRKDRIRWGPREIDIDILFYDLITVNIPHLIIPHPLLHERAFVLVPLAEIAGDFVHPIMNKTISELLKELKSQKAVNALD